MSKKIQTIVSDNIAKEIEMVIREDRFIDQSEFIRHCIREYLNHRDLKAKEMEAIIAELDQTADDLLGSKSSIEMGKEILAIAAPLKAHLKKFSKRENARELKTTDNEASIGMGKSQRDRIKLLRSIIKDLQDHNKGANAKLKDIIIKAKESGIKKETVEDMLLKLKSAGEIIESAVEEYRVVV